MARDEKEEHKKRRKKKVGMKINENRKTSGE